jgi:hypothetical protein
LSAPSDMLVTFSITNVHPHLATCPNRTVPSTTPITHHFHNDT